ncbi:PREDICTED: A disintegrin and metalloproteinase with thrombospondin motifs 17-like [Papilio polytes]|uniref:A disintegrin and metalloproteinase with thrombospondin motifs 17-like n=1 Tax=Papilio polytes TaxID=76194 RepID=UPI000675CAA9|nr:PREDICTED: A disintegrin and metalloproteinase with thrombospondin motifs 17-like [Papilio polytes]
MKYLLVLVCCAFDLGYCRIASDFNLHKTPQFTLIKPQPKNEITINIMMHFDKVLTDKLVKEYGAKTRKKLKIISNGILKDVENFYRHPSLNQNIKFKLKDTRFLKNNTKIVKMDENGSLYLKSYCEWQGKRKLVNDWYYSVLLTGLDLYYLSKNGEEVRRSTGRGYVGGVCSMKNSCALLEWNSKNIGYLLAHEIAHSLGINHDGLPYNQCRGQRYMMGAKYNPDNHPRVWSPCSKHALKRYLTSEKSWCLRPGTKKITRNLRLN